MIETIREKVKETKPLVHCITNPISIHQCANTVLAVGARPLWQSIRMKWRRLRQQQKQCC